MPSVRTRLGRGTSMTRMRRGEGPVELILMLYDLDLERPVLLPGSYPVGPKMMGALKDVHGVIKVEEF